MRVLVAVLALAALSAAPAGAGIACDDLGVGVSIGMMQPSGGDQEYEDPGLIMGLQVRKPLTDRVAALLDYHHGVTENGVTVAEAGEALGARFSTWGEPDEFRTVWNHADLSAVVNLTAEGKVIPFVSGGLGFTFWEVQDWRDEAAEEGGIPSGYNSDGNRKKLRGTNLTAVLGAGVEFFATENLACTIGGRYNFLLQSEVDNVGLSAALDDADAVDANNSVLEGYLALMYYFGPGDCDGDGIIGSKDKCSRKPEDFDGFEDEDGCPDPDNDGDGILDVDDRCPNDAEDFDGEADEDGCPDVDRDGDGILDMNDNCPDQPEDKDGYQDEDGCPDPDNDGDGVLDGADRCPGTPRGTPVDEQGCPKPEPPTKHAELMAVMVLFDLASDKLTPDATAKLDALVKMLIENSDVNVRIGGHACDLGGPEYNQALSERRAKRVQDYLASAGIDTSRMTMAGYGEMQPLVPNDNEEDRAQNRRAIVEPVRP